MIRLSGYLAVDNMGIVFQCLFQYGNCFRFDMSAIMAGIDVIQLIYLTHARTPPHRV